MQNNTRDYKLFVHRFFIANKQLKTKLKATRTEYTKVNRSSLWHFGEADGKEFLEAKLNNSEWLACGLLYADATQSEAKPIYKLLMHSQ